jgi:hypothetical protein
MKSRWYYKLKGSFYALGPTSEKYTEKEVRRLVRELFYPDRYRLPRSVELWRKD